MMTQTPLRTSSFDLAEEDLSFENIPYDPKLVAAIEEAQAEIARGEFFTLEEVETEFYSWFSK